MLAMNVSAREPFASSSTFSSNIELPSFAIPDLDLKYPVFQLEKNERSEDQLSFPVAVQVVNTPAESCCPLLAGCCTCFQPAPVLNRGDVQWNHSQPVLNTLLPNGCTSDKWPQIPVQYRMAPGYTKELLAPQMEYEGKLAGRLSELHEAYQKNFSPVATETHKKKQSEAGLADITSRFSEYSKRLQNAAKEVGFKGRDENYSQLTLAINLIHARFRGEVDELIGVYDPAKDVDPDHIVGNPKAPAKPTALEQKKQLHKFFTKEPWDTECKYLLDGIIRIQKGMTAAKMGSTLTSLQNGVGETPSFHIHYGDMDDVQVVAAVDRLGKEFKHSTMLIYELRLEFPSNKRITDSADTICCKVLPLFRNLAAGDVKIELLRITGTSNIAGEKNGDHEKVVTRILKALCRGGGQCLSHIERLDLSSNYVDFDTLKVLSDLMSTCNCTAINLSNLKLGLGTVAEVIQVPVRKGELMDCANMCCFTHNCDFQNCQQASCICCHKLVDNSQLAMDIHSAHLRFREKNLAILGHHEGGQCMRQIFQSMQGRHTEFKLDVVDLSNTNLPEICGGAENVAKLFDVIGDCRPTAVNVKGCGLTDLHAYALSRLFCKNPFMVHFSGSMCASSLESIEILQNLVQNSPILISGSLSYSAPTKIRIHKPWYETRDSRTNAVTHKVPDARIDNLCCCTGISCPSGLSIYPLCLKVTTTTHTQDEEQFVVPTRALTLADFEEYQVVMQRSMHEHRVIPLRTLLIQFANSPRKMDKLARAALTEDSPYYMVLSEEWDNKKLQLFRDFSHAIGLDFELEKQLEKMTKTIIEQARQSNVVTQQITDVPVFED